MEPQPDALRGRGARAPGSAGDRALSPTADRSTIEDIVRRLAREYGPLRVPEGGAPLDELVLTILSQHTSDTNAARAFAALRARFPSWTSVLAAREATLASTIRSGGLANVKAKRIRAVLREVLDRRGDLELGFLARLPDDEVFSFLATLPGVGPKTAAVVMAFSLGRDTIPVDTHVHRVTARLGLVPAKATAVKAQALLEASVPARLKTRLHVGLIAHGRKTCDARRPRCEDCVLLDLCPAGPRNGRASGVKGSKGKRTPHVDGRRSG